MCRRREGKIAEAGLSEAHLAFQSFPQGWMPALWAALVPRNGSPRFWSSFQGRPNRDDNVLVISFPCLPWVFHSHSRLPSWDSCIFVVVLLQNLALDGLQKNSMHTWHSLVRSTNYLRVESHSSDLSQRPYPSLTSQSLSPPTPPSGQIALGCLEHFRPAFTSHIHIPH